MEIFIEDEQKKDERQKRAAELAAEILSLAKNSLLVNFRYLQRALSHIELRPYEGLENIVFACDGRSIYYDPVYVLRAFRDDRNLPARSILHSLLHCIYRHGMTGKSVDMSLWNLACDAAVEAAINNLAGSGYTVKIQAKEQGFLKLLEGDGVFMSAERIYKWLNEKGISAEEADKQREAFKLDQHSLWLPAGDDAKADASVDMVRLWEDVSKKLQTELETMNNNASVLAAALKDINRTRRSYSQFLRRFGHSGELMRLSDEEFDNNYYSYGMSLYGNIPLIEPLEYREQRHIRSFVIAIDTSGSVQGEAVQSFVQKTYDIIKTQESFDTRVNLHILQCDDRIREDALIRTEDEFNKYIAGMQILGLGETDFRPVFSYVNKLAEEKKLPGMAGLLYFTDGMGVFPEKKPPYQTAFIIKTEEVYPPKVPPWAMRLVLEDDYN